MFEATQGRARCYIAAIMAPCQIAFIILLLTPLAIKAAQINWISDVFEAVRSFQFVFTIKTQGNRVVEQTTRKFLHYTWKLERPTILVTRAEKLKRYSPYRHQPTTCFVQVLLTQEPEHGMHLNNPLGLPHNEHIDFNLNTAVYTDIYLIFNVRTPTSNWMFIASNEHCLLPSNYHAFRVSPDGEHIHGALQMEPLTGDMRMVRFFLADKLDKL